MVFFQAHLLKKTSDHKLVPTYKIFFFVYIAKENWKQKAMKNKDKKARTTIESHYARKRPGKKHLTFKKWHNFLKVAKMVILQRL